jgi:hypothetical protein
VRRRHVGFNKASTGSSGSTPHRVWPRLHRDHAQSTDAGGRKFPSSQAPDPVLGSLCAHPVARERGGNEVTHGCFGDAAAKRLRWDPRLPPRSEERRREVTARDRRRLSFARRQDRERSPRKNFERSPRLGHREKPRRPGVGFRLRDHCGDFFRDSPSRFRLRLSILHRWRAFPIGHAERGGPAPLRVRRRLVGDRIGTPNGGSDFVSVSSTVEFSPVRRPPGGPESPGLLRLHEGPMEGDRPIT